jgi:hypothetical protein
MTLVTVCALGCGLMLTGAVAQARLFHPFISSFEIFEHQSSVANAIAVDQSSGDVYVHSGTPGSTTIDKFNSNGEKANFLGLGTNEFSVPEYEARPIQTLANKQIELAVSASGATAGDIYYANGGSLTIYGSDGSKLGELNEAPLGGPWGEPCGVAVDPAGNVYVGLFPETVDKYTPSGNVVTNADYTASMTGLNNVCQIAADSEGNIYAATRTVEGPGPVTKYEASQFLVSPLPATGTVIDPRGSSLAVDPSPGGDLYVDDETSVAQYSPSGTLLGGFGESGPGALERFSKGVAVKAGAGGRAYATGFRPGTISALSVRQFEPIPGHFGP